MIGDLIRDRREAQGVSQRALAAATGVGFPHISKIENGREAPSEELLALIALTLGMDPDVLILTAGRVPARYVETLALDPARGVEHLRAYNISTGATDG